MMSISFVKSSHGNDMLLHDGFLYVKDRQTNTMKIIWKCRDYQKYHCHSRIHTLGNDIVKLPVSNLYRNISALDKIYYSIMCSNEDVIRKICRQKNRRRKYCLAKKSPAKISPREKNAGGNIASRKNRQRKYRLAKNSPAKILTREKIACENIASRKNRLNSVHVIFCLDYGL